MCENTKYDRYGHLITCYGEAECMLELLDGSVILCCMDCAVDLADEGCVSWFIEEVA